MAKSSFNAFGVSNKQYGGIVPVWCGVVSPLPIGGSLASGYVKRGLLIPAGTPINIASGVITPAIVYKVKAASSGVITVDPSAYGAFVPEVGMYAKLIGNSFSSASGTAITAVAPNSDDASLLDITVAINSVSAGASIIVSVGTNVVPNAYLYNDILIEDEALINAGASGAAVVAHNEGILIDRTVGAGIATAMAAAVPNVIQVNG